MKITTRMAFVTAPWIAKDEFSIFMISEKDGYKTVPYGKEPVTTGNDSLASHWRLYEYIGRMRN